MLFGFEQILMQVAVVANGTATEIAGDAFVNSITSIMGSITALIIAVSGIVVAVITMRSRGRDRTKQEDSAIGAAEAIQLVMQKIGENEARNAAIGKGLIKVATTDEQRQYLDREVAPVVNTAGERIDIINAQIPAIKDLIGVKSADVNSKTLPRESEATLKQINESVRKAQANA